MPWRARAPSSLTSQEIYSSWQHVDSSSLRWIVLVSTVNHWFSIAIVRESTYTMKPQYRICNRKTRLDQRVNIVKREGIEGVQAVILYLIQFSTKEQGLLEPSQFQPNDCIWSKVINEFLPRLPHNFTFCCPGLCKGTPTLLVLDTHYYKYRRLQAAKDVKQQLAGHRVQWGFNSAFLEMDTPCTIPMLIWWPYVGNS